MTFPPLAINTSNYVYYVQLYKVFVLIDAQDTLLFQQNITFSDSSLHMLNCSIYSDAALTTPVWSIQRNLTGNLTYTKNDTIDVSTWTDGIYYENCTVTDY